MYSSHKYQSTLVVYMTVWGWCYFATYVVVNMASNKSKVWELLKYNQFTIIELTSEYTGEIRSRRSGNWWWELWKYTWKEGLCEGVNAMYEINDI